MTVVKVSPKSREALGLRAGQQVQALQYGDRVEFIPVKPMKSMRGFLKGISTSVPRDRDRV